MLAAHTCHFAALLAAMCILFALKGRQKCSLYPHLLNKMADAPVATPEAAVAATTEEKGKEKKPTAKELRMAERAAAVSIRSQTPSTDRLCSVLTPKLRFVLATNICRPLRSPRPTPLLLPPMPSFSARRL